MESRWCDEDREVKIYLQLVGLYSWWDIVKDQAQYSGYLGTQGDPRSPNALFIFHLQGLSLCL